MNDIDLRLPDEKRTGSSWRPARPSRLPLVVSLITIVVLMVFVVQESLDLLGKSTTQTQSRDPSLDQKVAERLADGGQYAAAASHLNAYSTWGHLPHEERARLFYRVADYYMRAGEYERALGALYRSELTAPIAELELDIKASTKRCYEMLGNIAGWEQELKRLTDVEGQRTVEGDAVVAEVEGRRITMLELDQLIEARVSMMLNQFSAYAGADELAARKAQLLKQFSTSEAKLQFLTGYVRQQVLLREALDRELQKKPDVMETLDQLRAGYLAQLVSAQEAAAAAQTASDIRDYYDAHTAEFVEPEQAEVSVIVLDSRDAAAKIIEELKAGAEFATLAKERSLDEATRDAGGRVSGAVTRANGVPGIGTQPELVGHIFALDEGGTSAEPLELDGRSYVFKVRTHTPARTKPFEEVEQAVHRLKYEQRRAELMEALITKLMAKYDAAIHPGAFRPESAEQSGEDASSQ